MTPFLTHLSECHTLEALEEAYRSLPPGYGLTDAELLGLILRRSELEGK
jgi:hypothetical protein